MNSIEVSGRVINKNHYIETWQ